MSLVSTIFSTLTFPISGIFPSMTPWFNFRNKKVDTKEQTNTLKELIHCAKENNIKELEVTIGNDVAHEFGFSFAGFSFQLLSSNGNKSTYKLLFNE